MWNAAQRLTRKLKDGAKNVCIIHLGDHDPSGIDMTRDIRERLTMFMEYGGNGHRLRVNRIALTMPQIEQYSPPPNPAKMTDSRFADYMEKYGNKSWELDALEPRVLENLIISTIREYVDMDLYNEIQSQETSYKNRLEEIADEFDDPPSNNSTRPCFYMLENGKCGCIDSLYADDDCKHKKCDRYSPDEDEREDD